jgi:hypothetical protein
MLTRAQRSLLLSGRVCHQHVDGKGAPWHRHFPCGEILDHCVFFADYVDQCHLLRWAYPHAFHCSNKTRKTGAIAWRIFHVGKPLRRTTNLWPIIFIVVESSALYAFGVTATLISFLSGTNGQYIAVEALVPLVVSYALHPYVFFDSSRSPTSRASSSL